MDIKNQIDKYVFVWWDGNIDMPITKMIRANTETKCYRIVYDGFAPVFDCLYYEIEENIQNKIKIILPPRLTNR